MEIRHNIYFKSDINGYKFIEFKLYEEFYEEEENDSKWVKCRNCYSKIALISDKININNTNIHIFENPAGIFYRIICFSDAPGLFNITEYTDEDTWFPGCSWSVSLCRSCNNHIGWHYNSGSGNFYGLIADRLTGV